MTRWTEDDLTRFTKNSGRGLPKATLQVMANATGKALDINGDPVPATPAEVAARAAVKETKARMEPPKKRKVKAISNPLMTQAESKAHANKFLKNLNDRAAAARAGKYKNTKAVRDGIRFDSILEADYYTQLMFEVAAKEIDYFLRQVPIHLPGGVILRVDFVTFKDRFILKGKPVAGGPLYEVHYYDTKGHQTRESKNKIKQAEHLYGIKVELVKKVRKLRT